MAKRYVLGANAARQLKALLRGSGEVSHRVSASPGLAVGREFAPPYTVQWAQSANGGAGSWIIWLPSRELVVAPAGPIDPSYGLLPVGAPYPDGWYLLDASMLDPSSGGTLYLNVETGDSPRATFSSDASSGDDAVDVPVCYAAVSTETGERRVKQFLASVVTLGGEEADPVDVPQVDGKSVGLNAAGKYEIKGWATPAPVEDGTIADHLLASNPYDCHLIIRKPDGSLAFIALGSLGFLNKTVPVLGDAKYDMDDHRLKKRVDTVNVMTGAVAPGQYVTMEGGETVGHSTTVSD